jgi:hypothetical protein
LSMTKSMFSNHLRLGQEPALEKSKNLSSHLPVVDLTYWQSGVCRNTSRYRTYSLEIFSGDYARFPKLACRPKRLARLEEAKAEYEIHTPRHLRAVIRIGAQLSTAWYRLERHWS